MERAAGEVADSRKTLLALPLGKDPSAEETVSPAAANAISQMKDHLNDLVVAYMACLPPQNEADPKRIVQDLSELTHSYKMPRVLPAARHGQHAVHLRLSLDSRPADLGKYGFQLSFEARATPDARRLISITATFDIACADDTVLWIFSPANEAWREVLRWQSKPYKAVDGAFWEFQYRISPPDQANNWFVATSYVNGWCASTWSAINYDILRVGSDASKPEVLLARSDFMYWGNENYGHLTANRSDSELRFDGASIDSGVLVRTYIRRYAVKGDLVYRIAPVAVLPRDFVDEWIDSQWSDAKAWSAATNLQTLQPMHETLLKLRYDPKSPGLNYDTIQRCTSSSGVFQVSVFPNDGALFYFRVATHPSLSMISVKQTPDSDCTGRNLLDDMAIR